MENNNQSSSFWQFSDQLRVQSNTLSNLSLNDSIWSTSYVSKRPEKDRRNFDIRVGGDVINNSSGQPKSNFNGFNFDWKIGSSNMNLNPVGDYGVNGGFNKGVYTKPNINGFNSNSKTVNGKNDEKHGYGSKLHGKNKKNHGNNNVGNGEKDGGKNNNVVDKRFKTLPPSESLPRNETVGGYIFVCNNDTMEENLKRQLFGFYTTVYANLSEGISPGLPLFSVQLFTHQLPWKFLRYFIFACKLWRVLNIDPTAWVTENPGRNLALSCLGASHNKEPL
ncbi:B2 protein-like protein [Tanacetum coccineum]